MSAAINISAENGSVVMRASGATFVFTPVQARGLCRDFQSMAAAADAMIARDKQEKLEAARKALDKAKVELEKLEGGM